MKLKTKEIRETIKFIKQNYGNNWDWNDIPSYILKDNKMKVYKLLKEEGKEKGFLESCNKKAEAIDFWKKVVKKST